MQHTLSSKENCLRKLLRLTIIRIICFVLKHNGIFHLMVNTAIPFIDLPIEWEQVKSSLCTPRGIFGNGGRALLILNLATTWRWAVSFTLRLLYPWHPLNGRLDGVKSPSKRTGDESLLLVPGIERFLDCSPRNLVAVGLCYPGSQFKFSFHFCRCKWR